MKTQTIRLLDVFVIGPAMVEAGRQLNKQQSRPLGAAMIVFGVATILYNGRNYLEARRTDPSV